MRGQLLAEPQIQVRMTPDLRRAFEEVRRQEPDNPGRPEMIRRLMKQAMSARQDDGAGNGEVKAKTESRTA